ncbi:hypothetical protein SUGI_0665140 [Cryptomeria japonica]|nr:hypothetical protein SUGI_0665140 [Cryptomeria japonica]
MEYWTEEALEKIERPLGTLMEIDADIAQGDSYLYARLQLATVRKILSKIGLYTQGKDWIQSVEIEEDKFFCLNCQKQNHTTSNCWIPRKEKKEWRPKQKNSHENHRKALCIEYKKVEDEHLVTPLKAFAQNNNTSIDNNMGILDSKAGIDHDLQSEKEELSNAESEGDELGITNR